VNSKGTRVTIFVYGVFTQKPEKLYLGKKPWCLWFSTFTFLCNQGQSCGSTYSVEQKILNV